MTQRVPASSGTEAPSSKITKSLNVPVLLSFLISLSFTVMGILILGNILFKDSHFYGGENVKILFGVVFILYGLFRGVTGYLKMKRENNDL